MAGPMPVFREIHRLRTFVHALQEQLDRIPRLRKAHQARLSKQEQALNEARDAIRRLKVTACDTLGDEILQALTDVDEKTAQIPDLEKALATVRDEVAKFEADSKARQA